MSQQIELYRFVKGGTVWTLTNIDEPYDYLGETYLPVPIDRGDTEQNDELARANLMIKMTLFHQIAAELVRFRDEQILSLTLFRVEEDWDGSPLVSVVWKGRVTSASATGSEVELKCESVFTSLRRPGLRARYQKACRHTLYGPGCGLIKEFFAWPGMVSSVVGTALVVPEAALKPDGYFTAGMVGMADGSYRFIMKHVGANLTLSYPIPGLETDFSEAGYGENYGELYGGVGVTLYPGCDHLKQTCIDKFDNLVHFGGFPWIPSRNPMDGSSII